MPHKVAFMSELDDITDEAKAVGAINTVFLRRRDGRVRYVGTNTDTIGIREAFLQNCPEVLGQSRGKPALVIGGGGACRSAIYALWAWLGISRIYMVNRLKTEVDVIIEAFKTSGVDVELIYVDSVEQARTLEAPVLVVGTVPDFPQEPGEILAREVTNAFLEKEEKGVVLEMCYHPNIETEFFRLAERNGWRVLSGTEPMIHQGVAQQVLWLEKPLEVFDVEKAKSVIMSRLKG